MKPVTIAPRQIAVFASLACATFSIATDGHQSAAGDIKLSAKGRVEMVYVPSGGFTMGGVDIRPGETLDNISGGIGSSIKRVSPGGYRISPNNEGPQRTVYLDGYWIGKNLVTVAQFREFTQATHYRYNWKANRPEWGFIDSHPMVLVSWEDARAFCKWAGGDLPTEAQWEKAARGTDGREYPWGNNWDPNRLWSGHSHEPAPIGSFPSGASPYGCLDMVGNTWQYCLDWFGQSYDNLPSSNPTGVAEGQERVIRGGFFDGLAYTAFRCAYRSGTDPKCGSCAMGFRMASQ
jgi:formylglycine-generating enzyme required for sulfatase activity